MHEANRSLYVPQLAQKQPTRPMTDHEQTALAALVAWREAKLVMWSRTSNRIDQMKAEMAFTDAVSTLDAATDLVIAERAAAVGR